METLLAFQSFLTQPTLTFSTTVKAWEQELCTVLSVFHCERGKTPLSLLQVSRQDLGGAKGEERD